jgi:uncharacterized protein (TIGR00725 family)
MAKTIIGIMGPGDGASAEVRDRARKIGRLAAEKGWVVLTGGRASGVMQAASQGAKEAGGLTIGVLPGADLTGTSGFIDLPIPTGMGNARNAINALSSSVLIAVGMGPGTASEVALGIKSGKGIVLTSVSESALAFFKEIGGEKIRHAASAEDAIGETERLLSGP